jgi:fermentation-respiration switch protein FrsA (DUF1100 family)
MSPLDDKNRFTGGFNAPEGYFESLEKRIKMRTATVDLPKTKTIYWQRYVWPLAASILLAIAAYWAGYNRAHQEVHAHYASVFTDKAALAQYIAEQGLMEEYLQQTGYPDDMPEVGEWLRAQTTTQDLKRYIEEEYEEDTVFM